MQSVDRKQVEFNDVKPLFSDLLWECYTYPLFLAFQLNACTEEEIITFGGAGEQGILWWLVKITSFQFVGNWMPVS